MKKLLKKAIVIAGIGIISMYPISILADANIPEERATTFCPGCYGTDAKLICNDDYRHLETRMHGNCVYNVYVSTVRLECGVCGYKMAQWDGQADHECRESHINCGLGMIRICGYRY